MSEIPGLDRLIEPDPALLGRDFVIVHVIPAATGLATVLVLLLSGVPRTGPSSATFVQHVAALEAIDLGVLLAAAIAMAFVVAPISGITDSLLEGSWSTCWGFRRVAAARIEHHRRRNLRAGVRKTWEQTPDRLRRARLAEIHDREYPWYDIDLAPTRLGNARRSLADRVGRAYGPPDDGASNDRFRDHVLVLRTSKHPLVDQLDEATIRIEAATSFVTIWLLVAASSAVFLAGHRPWWPLVLAPVALAWLAYTGAVRLTVAYSYLLDDCARLAEAPPPSATADDLPEHR